MIVAGLTFHSYFGSDGSLLHFEWSTGKEGYVKLDGSLIFSFILVFSLTTVVVAVVAGFDVKGAVVAFVYEAVAWARGKFSLVHKKS